MDNSFEVYLRRIMVLAATTSVVDEGTCPLVICQEHPLNQEVAELGGTGNVGIDGRG